MTMEIFQQVEAPQPTFQTEWPPTLGDGYGMLEADSAIRPPTPSGAGDLKGALALAALGGFAYGGWKLGEGRGVPVRLASTAGGALLGLVAALWIDPPFG